MTRSTLTGLGRPTASTAALTFGLLTAAGAFAPAALAADDASTPTTTTPETPAVSPAPGVLTPLPVPPPLTAPSGTPSAPEASASSTTPVPDGGWFGTGKIDLSLEAAAGTLGDGAVLDPAGAQLELHFSRFLGSDEDATDTCTFDAAGSCEFPDDPDVPTALFPDSVFSVRLVTPPASGQLLLSADAVVEGATDPNGAFPTEDATTPVVVTAQGAYRTVGVALTGAGPRAGATFTLCPVAGGTCTADQLVTATTGADGTATFAGRYLPGTYTVTQTGAPDGQAVDRTARAVTVPPATTVAERDTTVRLTVVGQPTSAPAPQAPPAAPAAPSPTATVGTQTVRAGAQQTVTLHGFAPHERVHGMLYSTPVDLGYVDADEHGDATFTFTVPAGFESGSHTITMTGQTSGATASASFTVPAADGGASSLAYTGADVLPVAAVGGVLVAAGGGALVVSRKRRSA